MGEDLEVKGGRHFHLGFPFRRHFGGMSNTAILGEEQGYAESGNSARIFLTGCPCCQFRGL